MNFRNSGKMPLILVREFWNLVIEKSVKSQGILLFMICGNPVQIVRKCRFFFTDYSTLVSFDWYLVSCTRCMGMNV